MYIAAVLTENFRTVRKGKQFDDLAEAKKAAAEMPIAVGQMRAVIDEKNMLHFKGVVMTTPKRVKTATRKNASRQSSPAMRGE